MQWLGLQSVACVQSERTIRGKTSQEMRFYLSSLPADAPQSARQVLRAVRSHWGIENRLHWVLDVAFDEDDSRIRTGNAAHNMATLRRLSLSLLQREKTAKVGVAIKRSMAGWDNDYLLKLLAGPQQSEEFN